MELGWIDFSKAHKSKVLSVINLLTEPGAVDELGVGTIRDGFSDLFFPGTSTIQTRAKYFLLVPYLMIEVENEPLRTPDKMMMRLHQKELEVIDLLKGPGVQGVIGEVSGKKLQRKPSDIYWSGIRRFSIFKEGRMSISDYFKFIHRMKSSRDRIRSLGNLNQTDDSNDRDDSSAYMGDYLEFWNYPPRKKNFRDQLTMELTKEEAVFLKEQITTSVPDSLLGHVLQGNHRSFLEYRYFDDLMDFIPLMPDRLKADYIMAKGFADFIEGAHIRYNMILSGYQDTNVMEDWERWVRDISQHGNYDLEAMFFRLEIKNRSQRQFLYHLKHAMRNRDYNEMDKLIRAREVQLKGRKRAKSQDPDEYNYKKWVGIRKLQYRLPNAQQILKDLFEGMGEINV